MSGFAHLTGQPDGPPTLPPFMLADGVAALAATLRRDDGAVPPRRARRERAAGRRQPHRAAGPADRVGDARLRPARRRPRPGRQPARRQRAAQRLPRPPTASGWPSRARRPTSPCGCTGPSTGPTWPRTPTTSTRCAARRGRSRSTSSWPTGSGRAPSTRRWRCFEPAEVAAAPVYDAQQLLADEHLRARGSFVAVDDPDLGRDDGAGARWRSLSETPGQDRAPRPGPRRRQRRRLR